MTFYYSMKQMFRSPIKSLLFFLLIGVSAFFLALGGNLWNMNRSVMEEYEGIFTTIGTVEQVGKESGSIKIWDADQQDYSYTNTKTYGDRISPDVLDFEGADYILPARQRLYFGAFIEDLYGGVGNDRMITVEMTPVETVVADHSAAMRVVKVLEGQVQEDEIIYFCDHYNSEPDTYEAGKTYIAQLSMASFTHGVDGIEEYTSEYWSTYGIESTQFTLDGKRVEDPVKQGISVEEVTDGFYETERGKRWILAAKRQYYDLRTIPVQPVDGTKLLLPFYKKQVVITEGRDITAKEYTDGEKVCLMSYKTAMLLRKELGDKVILPLYYANYSAPAWGGVSYINTKGQLYPIFNEQEYKIVGIYTIKDPSQTEFSLVENEVIIPWGAVPENSWKDNVAGYSRMKASNTSFEIPKGTISQYQELLEKNGIEDLKINFYDNGYTQIQDGLENRKLMSAIFLISGGVLAVMILLFFSNLFISGQRERIAIERLLGKTKKKCGASILSGVLVLAAAGCIIGSAAGWKATGIAAKSAEKVVAFDTAFSDTAIEPVENLKDRAARPSPFVATMAGSGLMLVAFGITSCYMRAALEKAPLELLDEIEE